MRPLTVLVMILVFLAPAPAQENRTQAYTGSVDTTRSAPVTVTTLHLAGGGVVRGRIIDTTAAGAIRLQHGDGNIFAYPITRIVRVEQTVEWVPKSRQPAPYKHEWIAAFGGGIFPASRDGFLVHAARLWTVGARTAAGLGTGVEYSGHTSRFPVYGVVRYFVESDDPVPYALLKAGVLIGRPEIEGGNSVEKMVNGGIGFEWDFGSSVTMEFEIMLRIQSNSEERIEFYSTLDWKPPKRYVETKTWMAGIIAIGVAF